MRPHARATPAPVSCDPCPLRRVGRRRGVPHRTEPPDSPGARLRRRWPAGAGGGPGMPRHFFWEDRDLIFPKGCWTVARPAANAGWPAPAKPGGGAEPPPTPPLPASPGAPGTWFSPARVFMAGIAMAAPLLKGSEFGPSTKMRRTTPGRPCTATGQRRELHSGNPLCWEKRHYLRPARVRSFESYRAARVRPAPGPRPL
eukprot:gene18104-biopygen15955